MGYIVEANNCDDEYYEDYEEALQAYETIKCELMADGHDADTVVTLYEVLPMRQAKSVLDEERMAVNTPADEGYQFAHWAKWDERIFRNSIRVMNDEL